MPPSGVPARRLRHRFHAGIASLTTRHPRMVVAVTLLLSVLLGRLALKPLENIDTDILNQLPEDMPEVEAYRRAILDFGAFDRLYGVIETADGSSDPALLIRTAEALAALLNNPEYVFEVQWSLDPDTQEHFGGAAESVQSLMIPPALWDSLRASLFGPEALQRQARRLRHLLASPLPPSVRRRQLENPWRLTGALRGELLTLRGPVTFDPHSGHFLSPDGAMLLLVIRPLKPPTDLLFVQELMAHARSAAESVQRQMGGQVRIGYLGPHAESLFDTSLLRRDALSTAIASGVCVVALFIIAFRRWSAILFVGLPLALGILWTLGLVALMIGHLTIVTCAFAAIVLGLGNDFGVHLYNRFLEDRLEGHPTSQSVRTALVEVGPGVFTGAMTTALAFFALLLSDFPGFRELGLIGGTGVLCCLASMDLVMPSLLMLLHHHRPRSRYHHLTSFGLDALGDAIARRPRTTLLALLIVTAWLGLLSLRLRFDDNLFTLRDQPAEQLALRARVQYRFRLPVQPLLLTLSAGPDLQTALEANDALWRSLWELSGDLGIAAVDSLRSLLPSVRSQERQRALIADLSVEAVSRELVAAAAPLGLSEKALAPAIRHLQAWQRETVQTPPLRLTLSSRRALRRLVTNYVTHLGDKYRTLTSVYPEAGLDQELLLRQLRRGLEAELGPERAAEVSLEVTGVTALVAELRALIKRDLALMVFVVTLGVLATLWVHFRSVRLALLVTVPVLVGLLWTLGLMAAAGRPLNFVNVLALPIIIGLGIDNGVHILDRHRAGARAGIGVALVKTGRAVVVTSLSTMLGFGALSLASFRGIQQMGVLALVGTGLALIAVITLIPAVIEALGRQGLRGLLRLDEG